MQLEFQVARAKGYCVHSVDSEHHYDGLTAVYIRLCTCIHLQFLRYLLMNSAGQENTTCKKLQGEDYTRVTTVIPATLLCRRCIFILREFYLKNIEQFEYPI